MKVVQLQTEALRTDLIHQASETPGIGSIVTFEGIVRSPSQGKQVLHLEFEAYAPMAIAEMEKIRSLCLKEFEISEVYIHHRLGTVGVGEAAVVVVVLSAHRNSGFKACAHAMDLLKQSVPIWKKEVFADGEVWVSAHP